jgi:hypothetical protein
LSSLNNVNHISISLASDNIAAEQFGRLLMELQALNDEIQRFNDRFEVVTQRVGERYVEWIEFKILTLTSKKTLSFSSSGSQRLTGDCN